MLKNIKYLFLVLSLILISGIPSFATEEEGFSDSDLQITETEKNKIVGKINFDEISKKAYEHSYDLQISDYNVLISKQGIRSARSEYFPKLNFSAGTEYTKNFRDVRESTVMSIGDAFINPYTRFQSILGVNVAYNLFDFGIRGDNLKIAKKDVKLKELELKEKQQELDLTLLDIYTKILVTTKQIEINNEILQLEQKNLDSYERLYKAKELSKTQLNDAVVKLKITKTKISDLKSIKQESLNWLSFYTGENYDIERTKVLDLKKSDFDVLKYNDYTKSIIWKKYEEVLKKKELELKVVKHYNYPKLNVYGRYYLYGSDYSNYGKSLGIEPSNFSVGAFLNMPLFDGFKNSANIEKTKLEYKQLNVERDKSIAQLMAKIANMRSNLIFLDEQIAENNEILKELSDKEKSIHRLASKKIATPIEENDVKIEKFNQQIEFEKNSITQIAITKGIEILTREE